MKKIIYLSFLLTTTYLLNAQITIESSDLPSLGDEIYIGNPTDVNIDVGFPSSTSQVWDFSTLMIETIDTLEFVSIAGTPAELEFQNSDMAIEGDLIELLGFNFGNFGFNDQNATIYLSDDADGNVQIDGINTTIEIVGFNLGEQNLISANPNLLFAHTDYGDSIQVVGNIDVPVQVDSLEGVLRLNFDRKIVGDAYGEITTPLGSWSCVRQKETTIIEPQIGTLIGSFFIPIPGILPDSVNIETTGYAFYTTGMDYPILRAQETNGAITTVQYQVDPTDLPPPQAGFSFEANCLVYNFINESTNATNYLWDFGDGVTSQLTNVPYDYDEEGTYTVTLLAHNNLDTSYFEQTIEVDDCINSIYEENAYLHVSIQNDVLVINNQSNANIGRFSLVDVNGRASIAVNNASSYTQFDVADLETGIYFVLIETVEGNLFRKKVLKF